MSTETEHVLCESRQRVFAAASDQRSFCIISCGCCAAPAVKSQLNKLAALIKAAQAEGMLNLVWGENTFSGLPGVRDLCRA